ncbi:Lrp/AsnC family transcriptional regulator [Candidatus Micrarchaeota archaeon]|nr:Lrp/AsnC family transcriptional regulator [Candidatus Micrarchaeota archaeon]
MELDALDRKILYELDMDARQSAKSIAKKIRSNKDTVNYRINRLIKEKVISGFLTRIDNAPLGFNVTKLCIRFQDTDEKKEEEFFSYLDSLPEVAWAVQASGRWDVLLAIWNTSNFSFYQTLGKILNRFSRNIFEREVIQNINWFYYNRKWLLPEDYGVQAVKYGGEPGRERLDKMDVAILERMVKDARIPFSEIGKKVRTSPQNVLNRVRNMEKKGIITKYGIDLNYEKLGIVFCKAFVALHNMNEESLKQIYGYCEREPKVFTLVTALGAWDLELEMEVSRIEEMMDIMNRLKREFPNCIRGYDSIVITKQRKLSYIPPLKI